MALASSRRPDLIEEEMMKQIKTEPLPKLKINKFNIFMNLMGNWYENLTEKERSQLTPKRFKRRAIHFLGELQVPYLNLPQGWVSTLVKTYDIKLYDKQKNKRVSKKDKDEDMEESTKVSSNYRISNRK
jgi:hypothetical protein